MNFGGFGDSRICRHAIQIFLSVAIFLHFLFSNIANQLSVPWTAIYQYNEAFDESTNSSSLLLSAIEYRSLLGSPLLYACYGEGNCGRNMSGTPFDPVSMGVNEAASKRLVLSLLLVALVATLGCIVAGFAFQFHACRVDNLGRPLSGPLHRRPCVNNSVAGRLLLCGTLSSLFSALFSLVAVLDYRGSVLVPLSKALPPPRYQVIGGGGYDSVRHSMNYPWGSVILLLTAYIMGPLRWKNYPPSHHRLRNTVDNFWDEEEGTPEWGERRNGPLIIHLPVLLLSRPGGTEWQFANKLGNPDEIPVAVLHKPPPQSLTTENPLRLNRTIPIL